MILGKTMQKARAKGTRTSPLSHSKMAQDGASFMICIQLDVASCCQKMPKERVSRKIKTVKAVKPVKVKKCQENVDDRGWHLQSSAIICSPSAGHHLAQSDP